MMNSMKNMFRKCWTCSHQGKPESTAGADCAMPGWFWMKAVTLGNSRKLCAKAIMQSSAAAPIGSAHSVSIQRVPMRMRGKIPCCGGIQ